MRTLAVAFVVCLFGFTTSARAQGPPVCQPGAPIAAVTLTTQEKGLDAPAISTHEVRVSALIDASAEGVSITPPPGVATPFGTKGEDVTIIAPTGPSVALTVAWRQPSDPSDNGSPACAASRVVELPLLAANPTHAVRRPGPRHGAELAIVPARRRPDLSPLEVSIRVVSAVRFPGAGVKARTMVVPMRVVDQVKYPKRLPGFPMPFAKECRLYALSCGTVVTSVRGMHFDTDALQRGIERGDFDSTYPLARTQPAKSAAPLGMRIDAFPQGGVKNRPFGFDLQVRQSGRLLARVRRAARCVEGSGPRGTFACVVKRSAISLARAAAAQAPPPGLPGLGDIPGQVARFKMTISGRQKGGATFTWDASPQSPCDLYAEGRVGEYWSYQRGADVVMEFKKVGGRFITLQRAGRQLGDGSFAAPSRITRSAGGFFQFIGASGACDTMQLETSDCGPEFRTRADLNLSWSKGKLRLQETVKARGKKNPARACGRLGDAFPFEETLRHSYPELNKQVASLSAAQIFDSKRSFRLKMVDKFFGLADPDVGYTKLVQTGDGRSTITLTRLGEG